MSKIYTGDTGTAIILDCGTDISGASSLVIKVLTPDKRTLNWVGVLEGTTKIKYVTLSSDLTVPGTYKLQSKVTMPSWSGVGDIVSFQVEKAL